MPRLFVATLARRRPEIIQNVNAHRVGSTACVILAMRSVNDLAGHNVLAQTNLI